MPAEPALTAHVAPTADLTAVTLYHLLKLRVDVFVVEQECPYPELDGRDLEPQTLQLWLARGDTVVACLRLLTEVDDGPARRIGRVAVTAQERGRGHAARLVDNALAIVGDRPCLLDAQAHLTGLYARHGFVVAGPEYVEDGIPHVPMRRPSDRRPAQQA